MLAHERRDRQATVGVDVDLAHAVLDAALDRRDRHAEARVDLAAGGLDALDDVRGDARRAVHDDVRVGQAAVDVLDDLHVEDVAVGLARELVGTVARADRDGEGVDARALDELLRLRGVGEVDLTGADAVLDAAERPQLALDGHAALVGVVDDLLRDGDVVLEAQRRLGVFGERAVHHDAREAELDRADAGVGRVAVVLMQRDGDVRVGLGGGEHQVVEEAVPGVLARAVGGLDDHR